MHRELDRRTGIGNDKHETEGTCMKAIWIGAAVIAALTVTVLAVAHGKKVCCLATKFLDHY